MKTLSIFSIKPSQILMLFLVLQCLIFTSCKKYLEAKSDQSIATPSTLGDLEGLLDNYNFINARYPSATEVLSDSYYLADADFAGLAERQRNFYSWKKFDDIGGDYTAPYSSIAYANIMLESLQVRSDGELSRRNNIQGGALFTRASYHYAIAQLFAKAFDPASAQADPGIALRLTSDITVKPVRSTISETYAAIISDLNQSVRLLSVIPALKNRPSRPAAYGMLARVYLSMRDYAKAGVYADSCLQLYNKLMDYNTISTSATIPFKQFNDEVIYDARTSAPAALSQARAKVDTVLYASYASNDLRKNVLFKSNTNGSRAFKGNYTGLSNASIFTGIATDEMYLIKSECAARGDDANTALAALNQLLQTRWKKGTFIPLTITDPQQLLAVILQERKRELLFRDLRWTDLKRLNLEKDHQQTIYRKLNNTLIPLEPGSPRYILQLDLNAVNISGLVQNP